MPRSSWASTSLGVLVDLLLGGGDGLADAAELEVKVGEAVLQQTELGSAFKRELVLLDRLAGVVRAAGAGRHVLVEMRETVVVVGGGAIRLAAGAADGERRMPRVFERVQPVPPETVLRRSECGRCGHYRRAIRWSFIS